MMSERTIAKLSLLCSLTGLAALYLSAANTHPAVTAIAKLNEDFAGTKVTISGHAIDLYNHPDGHLFLTLKDNSGGTISVPVFASVRSQMTEPVELLDDIQVTGLVKEYQNELEVVPDRASDVRIVHAAATRISNLGENQIGELVKVEGVVSDRAIVGSGSMILTLSDDGCQLPVYIPASVIKTGFPEVHVGYTVVVDGWLQLYNDGMELQLKDACNIRVIEAA
jgi:DNA/RNA endonuclease YhcR with UshA esterase domain